MAAVTDIEKLDLWVQSSELTEEDRQAIQEYIRRYREEHPESEEKRAERRAWFKARFGVDVPEGSPAGQ